MNNKLTINSLNVQNIEQFTKHEQENKMNNKPIAWTTDELNIDNWGDTDWQITVTKEKWSDRQIPLYTHPAKILNKEEILKLAEEFDIWLGDDDIEFIQFVLRKA